MRFVDCVTLRISAGNGGKGAVAWRRETYVPKGGPAGGDGGDGGSVILVADPNIGTLLDFRFKKHMAAQHGEPGRSKNWHGSNGDDLVVRLPVGTIVRNIDSGHIIADLSEPGARIVAAHGGRGGKGNSFFKTAVNQAPSYAQPGEPGESLLVQLEIKLLADIGIIGFPSVGKSTLISVISNARPKIADYPFTTLVPNLGLVRWHEEKSFVVADIPGIIEGAHQGRGLGVQFLRHVERCRALCHVIEVTPPDVEAAGEREPTRDFSTLMAEIEAFSPSLAHRPQIVALGKMDLPFVAEREPELRAWFSSRGYTFVSFSSATRMGLDRLVDELGRLWESTPTPDSSHFTVPEFERPADESDEGEQTWTLEAGD
jgi:GTP-binding protein